jgi:threonylcarbamoyladenosine tRNA methylthiotransferase MtaB
MKLRAFTAKQAGQKRKVLFETSSKNGMIEGYTDNYIRITAPYKSDWANQIVEWTV